MPQWHGRRRASELLAIFERVGLAETVVEIRRLLSA